MNNSECRLCGHVHPDDSKQCPLRCSACGGELDSTGNCALYCVDDSYGVDRESVKKEEYDE